MGRFVATRMFACDAPGNWLRIFFIALALSSVPGVSDAATGPVRTLRVALIAPRLATVPQWVAADTLAQQGYRIDWKYFQSDGALAQALASGAVELAINTPVRLAQMNEQGGQARMLTVAWATLDWVFVTRGDIKSVADLKGKVVGISSPGSESDTLFRRMLAKRGLAPEKAGIAVSAIGGTGARASALLSGRVQAAWLGYDAAYKVLQSRDYHVLENISVGKEFPDYISTVWSANLDYINANRQMMVDIVKAQILANRWAQDQKAFLARAGQSDIPAIRDLSREAVEWSHERFVQDGIFPVNGGLTPKTISATLGIALEGGEIKRIPAPDELAVLEIQQQVLREIGTR